jgi:hypothetical protein
MKAFTRLKGMVAPFVTLFGLIASPAPPAEAPQHWQLAFSYTSQSLSVLRAAPISAMRKQVQSPGLRGSALKVTYALTWLDEKDMNLVSTDFEMPIGIRSVMSDTTVCQTIIPESGVIIVRVVGPASEKQPRAIRLIQKNVIGTFANAASLNLPRILQSSELTLPLPKYPPPSLDAPGPISATRIRNTGDDRNRVVIVVMGDGYTSTNLAAGKFTTDTLNLAAALRAKSPWGTYFAATNIYRLDIESKQEGADVPPRGIFVDTYLNASFWTGGIEQLLTIDVTGALRAVDAADRFIGVGVWDRLFVLVNSTEYGGGAGDIAISSVHPQATEIIPHELGHSFAGLADEYEVGGTGPPTSDNAPNVDFDTSGPALKWLVWVAPGTPLPTPETSEYAYVVGAFEGALYFPRGIYRPMLNCLMRGNGWPFCTVCREAHAIEFARMIDFADSATPALSSVQQVRTEPATFAIRPVPLSPLTYAWTLGGRQVSGATSYTLTLTEADLRSSSSTLELKVAHPTSLVRSTELFKAYRWTVVGRPTAIGSAVWSLYK